MDSNLTNRVKSCYEDKFNAADLFDVGTAHMLENICNANSIPVGFLAPHLMATVSHFMNKSVVKMNEQCEQPSCLFMMACGYTSTNKSRAMSLVSNAMMDVEMFQNVSAEKSGLNQCKYPLY